MKQLNCTPEMLAREINAELRRRKQIPPPSTVLEEICNIAFFTSLKTEESKPITFHLLYIDPSNPDPDPPERVRNDRWKFFKFPAKIPLTIQNLSKIALASDPRSSSLAIFKDNLNKPIIVGLVDQANSYSEYIRHERRSGFAPPGQFHISADSIGRLTAGIEMQKIAELRLSQIVKTSNDVFRKGPIRQRLNIGINNFERAFIKKVRSSLKTLDDDSYFPSFSHNWISTLCRLLLRIQSIRHGGAILITPRHSIAGLRIKYPISYNRLPNALIQNAILDFQNNLAGRMIHEEYIEEQAEHIPADLYLDEFITTDDLKDSWSELDNTIWFLALLSRVDGLILLDPDLRARGFGTEILIDVEPKSVYLANNANANPATLKKIAYQQFGTRHRSMIRYCSQVPRSLGFVISQDGDVRAIANVRGKVIIWENLRLQLADFVIRNRRRWHSPYY